MMMNQKNSSDEYKGRAVYMKKVFSMLSIVIRSSIYKILLILLGMGAVETGLFYFTYRKLNTEPVGSQWYFLVLFERVLDGSFAGVVFLAAFALVCMVLIWAEEEKKSSKTSYLYDRLSVGVMSRYISWTLYNIVCLVLVFAVQLAVVFLLGMIYRSMSDPGFVISPMYLTAFFKSEFLHSLLPLEEWLKWIKNILFIIAISMEIADYGCRQKKAYAMMLIILLFLLGFIQEIGAYGRDSIMIAACLVSIVVNICRLRLMIDEGE